MTTLNFPFALVPLVGLVFPAIAMTPSPCCCSPCY